MLCRSRVEVDPVRAGGVGVALDRSDDLEARGVQAQGESAATREEIQDSRRPSASRLRHPPR